MDGHNPGSDAIGDAIALLTLVCETGSQDLTEGPACDLLRESYMRDAHVGLVVGLSNVAVHLLAELEEAKGRSAGEILQGVARKQAR